MVVCEGWGSFDIIAVTKRGENREGCGGGGGKGGGIFGISTGTRCHGYTR